MILFYFYHSNLIFCIVRFVVFLIYVFGTDYLFCPSLSTAAAGKTNIVI